MNLVDYLVLTPDPQHRQERVIREKLGTLTPTLRAQESWKLAAEQIESELGGRPDRVPRSKWKAILLLILDALVGLEHWGGRGLKTGPEPASEAGPDESASAGEGSEALTSG